MSTLAAIQQQFIEVLTGKDPAEFSEQILAQGSLNSLARIDIYRNAYHLRLKESIEIDHEMLGYYLGDDLFDEMVAGYIAAYPSQQTSLRYFSEQLPVFLADTTPFRDYPLLSELARFERYLLTVFDAPDADTATTDTLAQVAAVQWPQLHFRLHPSVQFYQCAWNAVEIWQALKQQQQPPEPNQQQQSWLMWRNAERLTEFSSLNDVERCLLHNMILGHNYADICEQLTEYTPVEQVSDVSLNCLVNWLNIGVISQIVG